MPTSAGHRRHPHRLGHRGDHRHESRQEWKRLSTVSYDSTIVEGSL